MVEFVQNLKERYVRYRRHASTVAFLTGFLWDSFTLTRIDLWLDNIILFTYLVIVGLGIMLINFYEGGYLRSRFSGWVASWAPVIMQFAFGGLFSGYMIFYTKSASLVSSWPFLLILAGLLIGNEFFEKKYRKLSFQMSIFFIAIFSFTIFSIPVLLGTFGILIFLLSGVVALLVIRFFYFFLSRKIPERAGQSKRMIVSSILAIYITINVLYFTNIIPPIPLALKDAGVYHLVERTAGDSYTVWGEKRTFKDLFKVSRQFHSMVGEPIYLYSAVFAPTKLDTIIFHRWQYFDEGRDVWVETDRVSFPISGGRDGGYRGYSVKENIDAGLWRVDVINKRNQLLGRIKFSVVETQISPILESDIL